MTAVLESRRPPLSADVHSGSANLVLVCSRHHTLIHSQGFQLVLHPDRRLDVMTRTEPVLHLPIRPWGDPADLDPERRITPSTTSTPPFAQRRMDPHDVVSVLLAQAD